MSAPAITAILSAVRARADAASYGPWPAAGVTSYLVAETPTQTDVPRLTLALSRAVAALEAESAVHSSCNRPVSAAICERRLEQILSALEGRG